MDDGFYFEIAFIILLILLNGVFAAAEIAVVTASRGRLQSLVEGGDRRAAAALRLKADPDRFLSTVQIGVTAVGTLASAVGGVAAIERLEPIFAAFPWSWARAIAEPAAVVLVVFVISYASLVVGELVPKALAVRHAEVLTLHLAPLIERLSRVVRPAVAALTASSHLVLRLLGRPATDATPFHTLDDLRAIVREAEEQGVVREDVVSGALAFHERHVREIMTPRLRVKALPAHSTPDETLRIVRETRHSRLPLYRSSLDDVTGFVYVSDVYEAILAGGTLDLGSLAHRALMVPGNKAATALLAEMREQQIQIALVVDERGTLLGIVTLEDLVEVIVGRVPDERGQGERLIRRIDPNVIEVDGSVPIHRLMDERIRLPHSTTYTTIGGLVLERLGSFPKPGQHVDVLPYRLTVTSVEGPRIASIRIQRVEAPATSGPALRAGSE
jgi:putative hemolysin